MDDFTDMMADTTKGQSQEQQTQTESPDFSTQVAAMTAAPGTAEYKQQINAYADSINIPQGPSY